MNASPDMSIFEYTFCPHSLMLVAKAAMKPIMLKLSSLAEQMASPPITGSKLKFT